MLRCRACGREFEGKAVESQASTPCPHCGVTPCYVDVVAKGSKKKKLIWPRPGGRP